jgi:RNase P protein component
LKKRSKHRWFQVTGASVRVGILSAAWVDVVEDHELGENQGKPVIISLPKTCGSAVLRNKFRRICKGYFSGLSEEEGWASARKALWIRMDRRHRLQKKVIQADWKPQLESLWQKLSSISIK